MIYYNESLCQTQIFHASKCVLVDGLNENGQIIAPGDLIKSTLPCPDGLMNTLQRRCTWS